MRPGERVGNYTILELLGRGGFGAVFKAKDEMTGALVALKAVHPDHARDRDFVRRLRDEARAAAAVSHPHVALFHTTGEHGGIPFLVFELVPGGTLDRLVRDRGPLPWREACARAAEIAGALSALHRAGIVHRDVKPENVLLDGEGRAKLADFGLVRLDRGQWHSLSGSVTGEGEIMGTFAFMSPEQADGAKDLDGRADLYSLGALLFFLLTGRPPFEGRGVEVLARLAKSPPPSARSFDRDVPARLDRLVLALLAKDRDARPRDALSVQKELEAIATDTDAGISGTAKALVALALVALVALAGVWIAFRPAPLSPIAPTPPPVVRTPPPPLPPPPPAPRGMTAEVARVHWLALSGDLGAMVSLGSALRDGRGVEKDEVEAVRWFRKAALGGNTVGMRALGDMFKYGAGVAPDDVEAVRWYRKAMEAKDPMGFVALGEMLSDGRGVAQDRVEAVRLFRAAADAGECWAVYDLGTMFANGWGVAKDDREAFKNFRAAADRNNEMAMFQLGAMLEEGRGASKDRDEAIRWYREAAARGVAEAKDALHRLGAD